MIVNVAPLLKQPVGAQAEYHVAESPIDPRGENSGLLEAGAVSRATLEAAQTAVATAEEALRAAQFIVTRAEYELQLSRARR